MPRERLNARACRSRNVVREELSCDPKRAQGDVTVSERRERLAGTQDTVDGPKRPRAEERGAVVFPSLCDVWLARSTDLADADRRVADLDQPLPAAGPERGTVGVVPRTDGGAEVAPGERRVNHGQVLLPRRSRQPRTSGARRRRGREHQDAHEDGDDGCDGRA